MRKLLVLITVGLLLLPCLAMAQYGEPYEQDSDNAFRARVGWFDLGDADSGLGVGLDYQFKAWNQKWLAGVEWADGDIGALGVDVFDVNVNWIGNAVGEGYSWYYGIGAGYYWVDGANLADDDSIGGQFVAGINFKENWIGEVRYVFGTDMGVNADVDGIRATIGYCFK